jgi:four helix bundle protein
MVKSFRDLELWKRANAVVLKIYRATNSFPKREQFGIVSQLRRAAYSIPANIAEGYGRRSTKELLQFLSVANGSLEELRYFLELSRDLHYLSPVHFLNLEEDLKAVGQMLEALAQSVKRRLTLANVGVSSSRDTGHGTRATKQTPEVTH